MRFFAWILLSFCSCLAMSGPGPIVVWERSFDLEEVSLSAEDRAHLGSLLAEQKPGVVYVVQGSACISGGPKVAENFARRRAKEAELVLHELGVDPAAIRQSELRIHREEPRRAFRKVQIAVYANQALADRAMEQEGGQGSLWLSLGLPLLAGLLFIGFLLWRKSGPEPASIDDHILAPQEADALAVLTGGAVVPLKREPVEERARTVRSRLKVSLRSQAMAKKKEAKITPISIRGALNKGFENRTLADLARSPVSALEGLTTRHARLLEEAFGVKTVEDLASLRYVEIARAIAVLARYET